MTTIIAAIIVLGVLIFVHELGHFLAAKATGVGVTRFSLGFPPRLAGVKLGETDYCIGWIPLGGYVKMVGDAPGEEIDPADRPRSFSHKSVWRRTLIVVAGPAANFLFAVVVFFLAASVFGLQVYDTTLGVIEPNTSAYRAGVRFQDKVIAVDGRAVRTWYDLSQRLEAAGKRPLRLTLIRGQGPERGRKMTVVVPPAPAPRPGARSGPRTGDPWRGLLPFIPPRVGAISIGKPADRANIKTGDLIVAVDGHPVRQFRDVVPLVRGHYRRVALRQSFWLSVLDDPFNPSFNLAQFPLRLTLSRRGRVIDVYLVPEKTALPGEGWRPEKPFLIGVQAPDQPLRQWLGPIDGAVYALERTWSLMTLIVRVVGWLISGQVSLSQMAGPVGIVQQAGQVARTGVVPLIMFAAFLSINLGILNLLPIPLFDGGHVVFFLIEAVRRKPVSLKARQVAQQFGLAFIIL
ncbi:MAG: RIP metalloprotease RseP, partial [Proteobacteria bacterium]|nr:RIP metalloprotease RseP [Pseudomonadota bacterium]